MRLPKRLLVAILVTVSACFDRTIESVASTANMFQDASNTHITDTNVHVAGRDIHWHVQETMKGLALQDDPLHTLELVSVPSALFDSRHRASFPRCLVGTRQSQLTHIRNWAKSSTSRPILWLSGTAGVGKSALAQTIAEESAAEGYLAASFFFQRGDDLQSIVPTIALHLAQSNKMMAISIQTTLGNNPRLLTEKSLQVQFSELVWRPSQAVGRPSLLIIDGLDELRDDTMIRPLLLAIGAIAGMAGYPVRFLITSRPEFPIEAVFRTLPLVEAHEQLHLGPSKEADNDIRQYLHHRFSEIRTKHSDLFFPDGWPFVHDIEVLVERAAGHFIHPSTVLNFVDYDDEHPKKSLDYILGRGSIHPGRQSPYAHLDDLFLSILRRLDPDAHRRPILIHLLAILSWKGADLSMCDAAELLDVALEEVQIILRGLRSVAGPFNTSEPHTLRFLHSSMEDFLMDPSRSQEFFIRNSGSKSISSLKMFALKFLELLYSFIDTILHSDEVFVNRTDEVKVDGSCCEARRSKEVTMRTVTSIRRGRKRTLTLSYSNRDSWGGDCPDHACGGYIRRTSFVDRAPCKTLPDIYLPPVMFSVP